MIRAQAIAESEGSLRLCSNCSDLLPEALLGLGAPRGNMFCGVGQGSLDPFHDLPGHRLLVNFVRPVCDPQSTTHSVHGFERQISGVA